MSAPPPTMRSASRLRLRGSVGDGPTRQAWPNAPAIGAGSGSRKGSRPIGRGSTAVGSGALLVAALAAAGVLPSAVAVGLVGLVAALALGQTVHAGRTGHGSPNVVVVGDDAVVSAVAALLRDARQGAAPRRDGSRRGAEVRSASSWAEVACAVRAARCDEVIAAGPAPWPTATLVDARGRRPALVDPVDALQRALGRVPLDLVGEGLVGGLPGPTYPLGLTYDRVKRGLDVVVALGLSLAALPLLPVAALAIWLESAGPIVYSQTRVGLRGRPFRIYKLRSMRQDAERHGAVYAQVDDPRVTRVGRLLRLARVDELPQLWNVLRGEMSLVGPRPERPEFTTLLEREVPHYADRYAVKPGLTGWAQVRYRYTATVEETATKLEYDLYYLKHASLRLDVSILLRTVRVILGMRGC